MKIASLIARLLLGLIFLVFGLNGFLQFIHMAPPTGVAAQFFGALFASHYYIVIFAVQVLGGFLLLANRFVPLALVILGPIIVNIPPTTAANTICSEMLIPETVSGLM